MDKFYSLLEFTKPNYTWSIKEGFIRTEPVDGYCLCPLAAIVQLQNINFNILDSKTSLPRKVMNGDFGSFLFRINLTPEEVNDILCAADNTLENLSSISIKTEQKTKLITIRNRIKEILWLK